MKSLIFCLISTLLIFSISCDKPIETREPGSLDKALIGHWVLEDETDSWGVLEFKTDGTIIDQDSIFGVDTPIAYTVQANESFTIFFPDDSLATEIEFEVPSYTCDEIKLIVDGFEFKLSQH